MENKKKFSDLLQQNIEFFEKMFNRKFDDKERQGIKKILREELPNITSIAKTIDFDK